MIVFADRVCIFCNKVYKPIVGNQKVCRLCKPKFAYERRKKWVVLNRERVRISQRKYRKLNLEALRLRDKLYKEKLREENRELVMQKQREWRRRNPEKHRAKNKRYKQAHKEQVNFWNRQREDLERGAKGRINFREWLKIKEKYKFKCPSCFRKEPEITLTRDHIIPLSKGGDNTVGNIQPLCGTCNSRKWVREERYACVL